MLIPGKTFLLGEYLALAGGPSIVANTKPAFKFSWQPEIAEIGRFVRHPFHHDSPAGRWLAGVAGRSAGLNYSIQFFDPHNGKGGLGASTAEFIGAWIFRHWLENSSDWSTQTTWVEVASDHRQRVTPTWKSDRFGSSRFRDVLDAYRTTTNTGSGADLVSQIAGGLAIWDARVDEMRRFQWPFRDLSFSLFATGKKMATHDHLARLAPLGAGEIEDMRTWVEEAVQALALEDADRFIASTRGFGKVLSDSQRVADHSEQMLHELAEMAGVRAAKGCGAMGSDVLFVLHDAGCGPSLEDFRERHELKLAATQADLWMNGLTT